MHDKVIRGGTIVDGTGAPRFTGDIAITDGRIVEVGKVSGATRQVIDANGALVTPGFIDPHTHYDGQFLWDNTLEPSFSHGVTTAIGGNCGVGFAPVRPEHRKALIELMEGVEEIPGIVLEEGLDWQWRSFPDYLDRLASRHYSMDIAAHISHAPLRVYVMGDRALRHEAATSQDVAEMAGLVREAMAAGAIGVSGARVMEHHSSKGSFVPGTFADDDELLGLARAMGSAGHGTFQIIPLGANGNTLDTPNVTPATRRAEHERIARIAAVSGRPVTYLLLQFRSDPEDWRSMIAASEQARAEGLDIVPQVASRGIGALTTLDGYHIFLLRPSYQAVAHLPLGQRAEALRNAERRRAILFEQNDPALVARDPKLAEFLALLSGSIANVFPMTGPVDYEPPADRRLGALAAKAGVPLDAYLYDHYVAGNGTNFCVSFVHNFASGNLDATHAMLGHGIVAAGLGDGGAHVRMICDASWPTMQLAFWARDRSRGPTLPLEMVVNKMSKRNADLYGLTDRGVIAPGLRADLNVIDHDQLQLHRPYMAHDLPSGGSRVLQGASGYLATLVAGEITRRNDIDTGARPGRLVRSRAD